MEFFLDESGNTGDNLIDFDQPFFTIASIGLNKESKVNILNLFKNIKQEILQNPLQELKTSRIIGTINEPKLNSILELIRDSDLHVKAITFEKKYMIAGKIVEEFFDPAYNNKVGNEWTHPIEIKKELANYFYLNLKEDTLKHFFKVVISGEDQNFDILLESINKDIEGKKFTIDVAETLSGIRVGLGNLKGIINSRDNKARFLHSPNYSGYFSLLSMIEQFLLERKKKGIVIFDSNQQFNNIFFDTFSRIKNAETRSIQFAFQTLHFGFKSIKQFSTDDSRSNEGLQMADFLSSTVNNIYRNIDPIQQNPSTFFQNSTQFLKDEIKNINFSWVISEFKLQSLLKTIKWNGD